MFELHSADLAHRRLAQDSFLPLWLHTDEGTSTKALLERGQEAADERPRRTFRSEGDTWLLEYGEETTRLTDLSGLHYLRYLMQRPGRPVTVFDLEAQRGRRDTGEARSASQAVGEGLRTDGRTGVGPLLDEQAKAEYANLVRELDDDIEEARRNNDPERRARAEAERDQLVQQLAAAVGLRGQDRPVLAETERARTRVRHALKTVLDRLAHRSPALKAHLDASLRTGFICQYAPEVSEPWNI